MVGISPALTVCASLVEKSVNQAALCRTCEVLGVHRLVLPNPDDSWEFRKISASAQQWQQTEYCAPTNLLQWLSAQTDCNRVALTVRGEQLLTEYAFSPQTILLLGRELTGIPAEIAALCDVTLTIPQYGKVESLNVQTAAAIAVYEYNRQWRAVKNPGF
ncbi:MAG: TrmH family RNA methyltransferase [Cyanobacteria bacterium P01_F01_bin.116]